MTLNALLSLQKIGDKVDRRMASTGPLQRTKAQASTSVGASVANVRTSASFLSLLSVTMMRDLRSFDVDRGNII